MDEVKQKKVILDEKSLLKKLKKMNIPNDTKNTENLTLEEIKKNLSNVKEKEKLRKIAIENEKKAKIYIPPGGWREKNSAEFSLKSSQQLPNGKTISITSMNSQLPKKLMTIAKFKLHDPKWDGSKTIGRELNQAIYRTPTGFS